MTASPRLLVRSLRIIILLAAILSAAHFAAWKAPPSPLSWIQRASSSPPRQLPHSCTEVLAIDRESLRADAERSINFPPSPCDRLILKRSSEAKTWRRATWAKVDVLEEQKELLAPYDLVLVRDIDSKVNVSFVMRALAAEPERGFIVGFTQKKEGAPCAERVAVTNWFAYWRGHRLVRQWRKLSRKQTDQYVLNEKLMPCCMGDVLCVDKCIPGLNEVHCRRPSQMQKMSYGSQADCIENETMPNHGFYAVNGNYHCINGVGHWEDW